MKKFFDYCIKGWSIEDASWANVAASFLTAAVFFFTLVFTLVGWMFVLL